MFIIKWLFKLLFGIKPSIKTYERGRDYADYSDDGTDNGSAWGRNRYIH